MYLTSDMIVNHVAVFADNIPFTVVSMFAICYMVIYITLGKIIYISLFSISLKRHYVSDAIFCDVPIIYEDKWPMTNFRTMSHTRKNLIFAS